MVKQIEGSRLSKDMLLKDIIYCFLVWRDNYARDEARHIVDVMMRATMMPNKRTERI